MEIKLRAIEINQPIGKFYLAKISGKTLYEMAKADIMTIPTQTEEGNQNLYDGIQRKLIAEKVKSIENYLTAYDATFPSSIILNVKNSYIISRTENELVLKRDVNTFTIIDGQHRLQGFKNNNNSDFEVIVSIFINLSKDVTVK